MEATKTGLSEQAKMGGTGTLAGPTNEAPPKVVFAEQDNWKHRSANMRCSTCMFFVEKSTSKAQIEDYLIGRCRRHAPTLNGWPVIFSSDWCGDHKLDEEKI